MLEQLEQVHILSVVGIDGAGKTTQAKLLASRLAETGRRVHLYHDPGPSMVRRLLDPVAREFGNLDFIDLLGHDSARLVAATVRLADLVRTLEALDLQDNDVLVMDRYRYCQEAAAIALQTSNVDLVRRMFAVLPDPTLAVYLDVPPAIAQERVARRGIDEESLDFLMRYDLAYRSLPDATSFHFINGTLTSGEVHAAIWDLATKAVARS